MASRTLAGKARQTRFLNARDRVELNWETTPRQPAAGVTSAPVKVRDPEMQRLIAAAIAKRKETHQ